MTFRAGFAGLAAVLLLAGCIDPIEVQQCRPMTYTVAEMRGDTTVTTTGLRFIEGDAGIGLALEWCQLTAVHYEAFLLDGTKFDSSRDRNLPLVFTPGMGALIDGLEQGVVGVSMGGTRRLIISPELGFGSEPRRNEAGEIIVPGNSTVVYDIQVVEIQQ
jgi:FKBP-type peptidyl-prolyl cis-trans isomerase